MNIRETKKWERGRIGEILQFGSYCRLGVEMEDLSDRTEHRAPLLYGRQGTIRSPDTNAIKTARFFLEFKTKTHHEQWNGGGKDIEPKVPARTEEGTDCSALADYFKASKRWRQPLVLSFLAIKEGELIAATLDQLGESRISPHPAWPIANWDVRQFSLIARFDPGRLNRIFNGKDSNALARRERWLRCMPHQSEVERLLDWLGTSQSEFHVVRQFIFDQIEREWNDYEQPPHTAQPPRLRDL